MAGRPGHGGLAHAKRAERLCDVRNADSGLGEDGQRLRSLERDEGGSIAGVVEVATTRRVGAKMRGDLVAIRRVAHDEHARRGEAIDDQIVEDGPALVAAAGVGRSRVFERADIVGDERVDDGDGARAGEPELPHVRHVEEPARSRTAACSAEIPLYCTGISKPANGTRRAFSRTCSAKSGVRRSSVIRASVPWMKKRNNGRSARALLQRKFIGSSGFPFGA